MDRLTFTNTYAEDFKHQLSTFANTCAFCHVFNHPDDQYHLIETCITLKTEVWPFVPTQFYTWKKKLFYDKKIHKDSKICFLCHVPQGENDQIHPTFTGNVKDCPYPDVIAPVAYAIMGHKDLKIEASKAFPSVKWSDNPSILSWLVGRPVEGHLSNLSALFLWYARRSIG
jgi:hypothetical protein